MSNESYRIKVNIDDDNEKFIKVKLEQDVKFLDILSLQIDQRDTYQFFNADYGVLVGRVNANGRVGIPNAKISIFIPIDEEDQNNPDIAAIYPYESPRDVNANGKRYNLLPRVAKFDREAQSFKPRQPFGSFPIKEEILTNETWLEVYKKYYKYTTVTNSSGDYMLFGVPVGVQTVHMSVDITDIGQYSMTPQTMVTALGYSPNLFTNNNSRIKPSEDLNDLPNIETQEISVDIIPFWGDSDNFDIGITRQDFRIRAELTASFTLFGSHATMNEAATWGDPNENNRSNGFFKLSYNGRPDNEAEPVGNDVQFFRTSTINPDVYYYPNTISDSDINSGSVNTTTDIFKLDESSFYFLNEEGQFIMQIPCNRKKVITDEFGNQIVVSADNPEGIFTEFKGMMILEYDDLEITIDHDDEFIRSITPKHGRSKFKIPQSFGLDEDETVAEVEQWRKEFHTFKAGDFYTISQFMFSHFVDTDNDEDDDFIYAKTLGGIDYTFNETITENPTAIPINIKLSTVDSTGGTFLNRSLLRNAVYKPNATISLDIFGGQWINGFMFFPQFTYAEAKDDGDGGFNNRHLRAAGMFYNTSQNKPTIGLGPDYNFRSNYYIFDNAQKVVNGKFNTKFFANTKWFKTAFVNLPREDLIKFREFQFNGFNRVSFVLNNDDIIGNDYKYRVPTGSYINPENSATDIDKLTYDNISGFGNYNPYFSKGIEDVADTIERLFELNLI